MTLNTPWEEKMNKRLISLISAAALASTAFISSAFADSFTLRIGSGHPSAPTPYVRNLENVFVPNVVARVAAETDHKIKFIEAYGGKIAKVHETLEAVEKGLLDIGAYCVCFETAKLLPLNFDYFVPFTHEDPRVVNKVKAELIEKYPELTAVLTEKYNQVYLPGLSGFDDYGIGTVEPWKKADELKGRKIVAAGPNLPWVSLFGAIPVTSTLPTMYNDMATGVAEGTVIFPTAHGGGYKFYEVAPYWTVTGFGAMNQNILTINANTAAKLPADVMAIIEEEALVYSAAVNEDAWVNYEKGLDKLVKVGEEKGLSDTVYYLPMDQQVIWAETIKDWPNTRANDIMNEYGVDAIKIMDEYMDMMEAEGHEWPVRFQFSKL